MTNCEYGECQNDASGRVVWENGDEKHLCQGHMEQARENLPELLEDIELA